MSTWIQKTYSMLSAAKKKGVTCQNFPKGLRLSAIIYVLRKRGANILTLREGKCKAARYVMLKGVPKN